MMGRLRLPSSEASEVGVGSGKEGAKEAHPEWTPAMWGFPEPHNSLQRRDRSPVFSRRLGPPLPSSSTPLCPAEGPGEPGCQQPPPECPQGHRVLAGPQNNTASGPHGRQGVWHGSAGSPDDIQKGWMGSPPAPGLSFPGGSLFIPLID